MSVKEKAKAKEGLRLLLPLRALRDFDPENAGAAAALVNKYKTAAGRPPPAI